jgi:Zn-finger nucleic acid-binding protein
MLCPECKSPLVILEVQSVELDACPEKHGLWFDAQEVEQLFHLAGVPEDVVALAGHLRPHDGPAKRRRCPRCGGLMEVVRAPGDRKVVLDRCRRGHGLWFDQGEVTTMLEGLVGDQEGPLERVRAFLGDFAKPPSGAGETKEDAS